MKILSRALVFVLLLTLPPSAAMAQDAAAPDTASGQGAPSYGERYRPQIHFSPVENWMNDPNGMVYYNGEYHLFYQHNPFGNTWGHMSWGHAVSRDLVHWEHLPVALAEEDSVMIFSGSAVVDWTNTSGLGTADNPPMVAIYTGHHTNQPLQDQRIAYSLDSGRTWTKYEGNPVLDIGMADFRDPKVIWYAPEEKWVMVVALPLERKVRFYASDNLIDWTPLSDFGPAGAIGGIWECPDLFPLPVDGHADRTKWVLVVNLSPGAPAGGSGGQHFIGDFDGQTFTPDADRTPAAAVPEGETVFDFENGYDAWDATGEAFAADSAGAADEQRPVFGAQGQQFAHSGRGGAAATGTLTSPAFTIERGRLNFLLGGGGVDGTRVELLAGGEPVRTAGGHGGRTLEWASWDVADLSGQDVRLRIVDESGAEDGALFVDHVLQSDTEAVPSTERADWLDYGADFYAAVSWSDIPEFDGRRLMIGWMNNWGYAQRIPTSPWRSAQSLPRRVLLRSTEGGGAELLHQPVVELRQLRRTQRHLQDLPIAGDTTVALGDRGIAGKLLEIVAEFEVGEAEEVGLAVRRGAGGEETLIGYDAAAGAVFVDRTNAGEDGFDPAFAARHGAPLEVEDGRVTLHVFVDWSSVDVFAEEGRVALTDRIFPDPASEGVALYAKGGAARLVSLDAWELDSAWTPRMTTSSADK